MARSFFSSAMQAVKAAERAQRSQQRALVREERQRLRELKELARLDRQAYIEERVSEIEEMNADLDAQVEAINTILSSGLSRGVSFDWSQLKRTVDRRALDPFPELALPEMPTVDQFQPSAPGFFARLIPGAKARYQAACANGEEAYRLALNSYNALVMSRKKRLEALKAEADDHNAAVDALRLGYLSSNPPDVVAFFEIFLERCDYPDSFPSEVNVGYLLDSRHVIVDLEVPTLDDAVPAVESYRYTKSTDAISEKRRTSKAQSVLYTHAIAQVALRRLYEIFRGDKEHIAQLATLNVFVSTTDPATVRDVRPCLVSVRASRDDFEAIDLTRVEPSACLKRLNASVSRSPAELAPVKPLFDINMSDPRFIQEADVLGTLDTRPNLMELTPGEFENLITNLFQKMGLETRLTQASRDGGVDCVAFDPRPVIGGKVVVQAKRYKNTVGVSAVRDLFGTMHNEGASKGILVTTSGDGKAAAEFANNKPIELLSGSNLLFLLKEHAGIDAKIVIPDNWSDPAFDRPDAT